MTNLLLIGVGTGVWAQESSSNYSFGPQATLSMSGDGNTLNTTGFSVVEPISGSSITSTTNTEVIVGFLGAIGSGNTPPTLSVIGKLEILENMPIGSVVGHLIGSDPDGDVLTFSLVTGLGDIGNESFSLSTDGILSTATVFDYESQNAFSIRAQVSDSEGEILQEEFMVYISDGTAPLVETKKIRKSANRTFFIGGTLLDRENQADNINVGILVSNKPIVIGMNPGVIRKELTINYETGEFGLRYSPPRKWKRIYVRAYAENPDGVGYGLEENLFLLPGYGNGWGSSREIANAPGWWESPWLGNFYKSESGWLLHIGLGWVYPSPGENTSLWLWKDNLGWIWTNEKLYPCIYNDESGHWMYFFGEHKKKRLLYDYGYEEWFDLDDSKVNESVGSR